MSQLVDNVETYTNVSLPAGTYDVPVDNTNLDSLAISVLTSIVATSCSGVLTLEGSVDGINFIAIPSTIALGNPVTLSLLSDNVIIFNVQAGSLAVKYLQLNLELAGSGTILSYFTVNVNYRNNSIKKN